MLADDALPVAVAMAVPNEEHVTPSGNTQGNRADAKMGPKWVRCHRPAAEGEEVHWRESQSTQGCSQSHDVLNMYVQAEPALTHVPPPVGVGDALLPYPQRPGCQ